MLTKLFGTTPSEKFEKLICEHENFQTLKMEIHKNEILTGFKNLKKVSCAKNGNLKSVLFILTREDKQAISPNYKIEEKSNIITYLKNIEKGDQLEIQLLVQDGYLKKISKIAIIK